jgi:hypothetical protein
MAHTYSPVRTLERLAFNRLKNQYPLLQRNGFEKAVRAALNGNLLDGERIGFIPDGWFRLTKGKPPKGFEEREALSKKRAMNNFDNFVAFEIEDQHTLSAEKLWRYCDLFDTLDFYGMGLLLIVCDRYGHNQRQLDLSQLYFEMLREKAEWR